MIKNSLNKKLKKQLGLSLIELMIALALGSFLVLMIIQIALQNRNTSRLQEAMAQSQENARFAIEMLARDIRSADYWGCAKEVAINFAPLIGAGVGTINGTYNADSDRLQLTSAYGGTAETVSTMVDPNSAITITTPNTIQQCDYVLVTDCENASFFRNKSSNPAIINNTQVVACAGGVSNGTSDYAFVDGAFVLQASSHEYEVAQISGASATTYGYTHRLMRKTNGINQQPIVGGIERIRFLYGIDTDGDNMVNVYRYADTVTANNEWQRVVAIRYEIVTQSAEPFALHQPEPYWFDGQQVTPNDRRFRRVYSGTVAIRNRVI